MGKRIPTVNYSFTKEIGTYAANGLALVEFKFMTTSVLAGAKNKQVSGQRSRSVGHEVCKMSAVPLADEIL